LNAVLAYAVLPCLALHPGKDKKKEEKEEKKKKRKRRKRGKKKKKRKKEEKEEKRRKRGKKEKKKQERKKPKKNSHTDAPFLCQTHARGAPSICNMITREENRREEW